MKHHETARGNSQAQGAVGLPLRLFTSTIGKQWIILPSAFAMSTASGIAGIGLLFYVRDVFGAPPALVSLFAAVWTAMYASAVIVLRPLSVRLLPRHSLMIASGGMTVGLSAILLVHSLAASFLLYALSGVALSFFWPPIMGWLSVGLENRALSSAISRYNLSWSTGSIISPFLGGLLYEQSRVLPIYVSAGLLAGTTLFIAGGALFLPKIRADVHREEVQRRGAARLPDSSTPLRFPARFVLFVAYFGFGIIANVLPLDLRSHLGLSEGAAGLMLLIRSATMTGAFLLLARFSFWQFKRSWIIVAQIVVLVVLGIFGLVSSVAVYAVGVAIYGAAMGLIYNSSVFHSISGSRSRAGRMAINESTLNAAAVAGSIAGGVIYQAASINYSFFASVILGVCSLAIVLVLPATRHKATPAAEPA